MGFFESLRAGLTKTRGLLSTRVEDIFKGRGIDDDTLEELEEALLGSDVGVRATTEIIEHLRKNSSRAKDAPSVREFIRAEMAMLLGDDAPLKLVHSPHVVLVVGVNGVGKTTTIGKLASRYTSDGRNVILCAADTFRAAAIEQLEIWADRAGAQLIRHQSGSDPAAVAFDSIEAAKARRADLVIIDTAGRLHTKSNLMEELKKVNRVIDKSLPGAPHDVLLVLDATTGQNGLRQAEIFKEAVGVTGVALTKLDGTAKGGIVFAIRRELGIPVKLIGVGEKVDDLQDFHGGDFVKALFE